MCASCNVITLNLYCDVHTNIFMIKSPWCLSSLSCFTRKNVIYFCLPPNNVHEHRHFIGITTTHARAEQWPFSLEHFSFKCAFINCATTNTKKIQDYNIWLSLNVRRPPSCILYKHSSSFLQTLANTLWDQPRHF